MLFEVILWCWSWELKDVQVEGANFTNNFSIMIQIQWNHFWSNVLLFFSNAMAAHLLCHVQSFATISWLEFGWDQMKFSLYLNNAS